MEGSREGGGGGGGNLISSIYPVIQSHSGCLKYSGASPPPYGISTARLGSGLGICKFAFNKFSKR